MKKKIGLFLALIMTFSILVGCTSEQVSFVNELNKLEAWEAASLKQSIVMAVGVDNEIINFSADVTAYTNTKDQTSTIDMKIVCDEFDFDIPVKMYIDKEKVYINKDYFKALASIDGSSSAKINKLNAEYIMLDVNGNGEWAGLIDQLTVASSKPANFSTKLLQDIATEIGLNIPIAKENNTYKVNLTSDQLVDLGKNIIDTSISKLDKLNTTYKLGLSQVEINDIRTSYNSQKMELEQSLPEIKEMVQGSSFDMVYTFEEAKVKQTASLVLKVQDTFNMTMKMSAETTKEDPKTIEMPKSAVTMTFEDISELFTPSILTINVAAGNYKDLAGNTKAIKTIKEKGKVYLPLKQVLSEFGYQVSYDQKAKKVYAMINNEKVIFSTLTKNGVAYVSVDELFSKKYFTGYSMDNNIIQISLAN